MSTTPDPARAEALAIWDREIASHRETTPCSLCPTKDGVRPLATVRAWIIVSRAGWTMPTARRYYLCEACRLDAVQRGDLVPGAEVVVL